MLRGWYKEHLNQAKAHWAVQATHGISRQRVIVALIVLGLLVFSKYFYMANYLLHLLPDREIRGIGGEFAVAPVPVPQGRSGGDLLRRADR